MAIIQDFLRGSSNLKESVATTVTRLNAISFFLRGVLKKRVIRKNQNTSDALTENITNESWHTDSITLSGTTNNTQRRIQMRLAEVRGQFQHIT